MLLLTAPLICCLAPSGARTGTLPEHTDRQDPVIGLSFRGRHRAYPLKAMVSHRVVNDEVSRQEIVLFFDPERDFTAAYFRVVLGEPIEFSGMVEGAVADDITTITRWDLTTGTAVAGNLYGTRLVTVPFRRTTLGEWLAAHPDTSIWASETD